MRVIWQFPLELQPQNEVTMPKGARVVHVGTRDGAPCLWALCDPNAEKERRRFMIARNGLAFDETTARYVGTFTLELGAYVGHVLEPASAGCEAP